MLRVRSPGPALGPFVKTLWVTDEFTARPSPSSSGSSGSSPSPAAGREHVLPTGEVHVALRLSGPSLRVFDDVDDLTGRVVGHAIVGGARSTFYVRDVSSPVCSVGAQLRAGAAELLFGVPAAELAERHTRLDDLWGRSADAMRERLLETKGPERRLDLFESLLVESLLAARLPQLRALHPAVAHALGRFATAADVRAVVAESGYSHRHFVALFRRAVGLTPKLYCRIARFQRALERLAREPAAAAVDLALAAGYSDQPHFNREFRALAGLSPGAYRDLAPLRANHVPVPGSGPRPAGAG